MLSAPDTRRWPPADSYINNLFLAATHQQIRMKMTDKDNEQSKYWRNDQKNDNCPVITHKLHNIKKRSDKTALVPILEVMLQAASVGLAMLNFIDMVTNESWLNIASFTLSCFHSILFSPTIFFFL